MTAQLFPPGSLSNPTKTTELEISKIIVDSEIVGRADGLNQNYISELETCLDELPPIEVFSDGDQYWLVDGNHRLNAFQNCGESLVLAKVQAGDRDDALLYSAGTNAEHGLRRTTADKQAQVAKVLRNKEWAQWSDREISRRCKVSAPFVGKMRRAIESTVNVYSDSENEMRLCSRGDKVIPIRTANIGKKPESSHVDPNDVMRRYERVGRILPSRTTDGFVVENGIAGPPFPLAFTSANVADLYWQANAEALERVADQLADVRSQVADESKNPEFMPGDDDWSGHSDQPQPAEPFFDLNRVKNQSVNLLFNPGDRVMVTNPDSENCNRVGTVGEPWDSTSDREKFAKVMLDDDSLYSRIPYGDIALVAEPAASQKLPRIDNDYYRTYPELVDVLLREIAGTPHEITGQVLEPTVGDGVIANFFNGCITNDLHPHPDWSPDFQMDATDPLFWQVLQEQGGFDWAVGNPPWAKDVVSQIVQQAYSTANRGVAFLLRLSYLEPTEDRGDWHLANVDQLRFVIPVNPRPLWRTDTNNTEAVTCCWFFWDKEFSWKSLGLKPPFRFARNWRST